MNIKNLIFILLVILILGGAYYYNSQKQVTSEVAQTETQENVAQETNLTPEEGTDMNTEMPVIDDLNNMIAELGMNSATVKSYLISAPSTVSYNAEKTYFGKAPSTIVGVSDKVVGYGLLDTETNLVYLTAVADLSALKSDSAQRDSDIQDLFIPATAIIEVRDYTLEGFDFATGMGQNLSLTVPVSVTINSVTKEVPFTVEAVITEDEFKATGTANVKMSDFGITAPSLLNVFAVADDAVFKFEVLGTKVTL